MRLRFLLIIMCFAIVMIPIGVLGGLQNFQIATVILLLILAVTLIVSFAISFFISQPLVNLTKNINEISKGNLDVELEQSEIYEINNLTASLDRVMASLKLAIHKAGVKKEEIFEEAIKAKQEAEQKYETLLKKIDGWIWEINEQGICTKCSPKVSDALGYPPTQIIGKDIVGFLPSDEARNLHTLLERIQKEKNDATVKVDTYWIANDHHPVWVRTYIIPVFDGAKKYHGLRCFSRDISDYKLAQEKIEELHHQLNEMKTQFQQPGRVQSPVRVVDASTQETFDYMFMFDENTKIVDCTEDIHKKLGYRKDEMLALTLGDFKCLESADAIKACMDDVKKNGIIQMKTIHKKKDGSPLFVSEHIKYIKERNMFICLVKEDFSIKTQNSAS